MNRAPVVNLHDRAPIRLHPWPPFSEPWRLAERQAVAERLLRLQQLSKRPGPGPQDQAPLWLEEAAA